jgi:short-subunit dehydrogenase
MKILVTGASSIIGESLAAAFSQGNQLVLLGRDPLRLQHVQARCIQSGAVRADARAVDIAHLAHAAWREFTQDVDLIVHAAFHLSDKRDDQIASSDVEEALAVNLLSPLRLFLTAARDAHPGHPLGIILISSFLAKIRSPNRLIYGSLKLLQEEYLRNIARNHPSTRVLIVHVGQVIPTDRHSAAADALAAQVVRAYDSGKTSLTSGHLGNLLVALFYVQPLIYFVVSATQRWLRRLTSRLHSD